MPKIQHLTPDKVKTVCRKKIGELNDIKSFNQELIEGAQAAIDGDLRKLYDDQVIDEEEYLKQLGQNEAHIEMVKQSQEKTTRFLQRFDNLLHEERDKPRGLEINADMSLEELKRWIAVVKNKEQHGSNQEEKIFYEVLLQALEACKVCLDAGKSFESKSIPVLHSEELWLINLLKQMQAYPPKQLQILDTLGSALGALGQDTSLSKTETAILHRLIDKLIDAVVTNTEINIELFAEAQQQAKLVPVSWGFRGWINYFCELVSLEPIFIIESQPVMKKINDLIAKAGSAEPNQSDESQPPAPPPSV